MSPSSSNPYLTAAMADTATASIITELSELLADEARDNPRHNTKYNPGSQAKGHHPDQTTSDYPHPPGGYVSAVDPPAPSPSTAAPPSGYVSATAPDIAHQDTGYTAVSSASQAVEASPKDYSSPTAARSASHRPDIQPAPANISPYLSPKDSWELEKQQKQQAQARAQQHAQQRHQQEQQAKRFLAKLSKLDPLEGTRMWFEDFAKLCPSRLEAAIEFLATVPTKSA